MPLPYRSTYIWSPVSATKPIKHWMRMAQRRSVQDTWQHFGKLVQTIAPSECQNYIANARYRAT